MFSLKRVIRFGIPAAVLALGVTVYAQSQSNDCAHPSLVAKAMKATGMGKIQTCEILYLGDGEACLNEGKHCNIGNGAGKCTNVTNTPTGNISCQCVPNH